MRNGEIAGGVRGCGVVVCRIGFFVSMVVVITGLFFLAWKNSLTIPIVAVLEKYAAARQCSRMS